MTGPWPPVFPPAGGAAVGTAVGTGVVVADGVAGVGVGVAFGLGLDLRSGRPALGAFAETLTALTSSAGGASPLLGVAASPPEVSCAMPKAATNAPTTAAPAMAM